MAYAREARANIKKKRKEDALALAHLIYDIYKEQKLVADIAKQK
jgi:hypothetical protein